LILTRTRRGWGNPWPRSVRRGRCSRWRQLWQGSGVGSGYRG